MAGFINFSMKLQNEDKLKKDILRAMKKNVSRYFKSYADNIKTTLQYHAQIAIENSPTIQSLESGILKEEFGLEHVNSIGLAIQATNIVNVKVEPPRMVGEKIVGKFRIEAFKTDLQSMLGGTEPGTQKTEKGQVLPWLEWLLTLGDAVIVRDYEVRAGFPKNSRTGDKIMVRGKGWRVPPEHAGTEENNFLTKAIDEALPKIEERLIELFTAALGAV